MNSIFLSIIIPAHNEEFRLPGALGQVYAFINKNQISAEVIVVENGSTDRTLEVARNFINTYPDLHVLHEDLSGKGRAVRRGILEAVGEYRFIADVDFSMPVDQINRFLPPVSSSDITIASREAPGARRIGEPPFRHLTGRVFNFFIRRLALLNLQDTQCGFKCFRGTVAEDIFRFETLNGWAFDVEVLVIACRRGYTISEIGVPWTYTSGSKINVMRDSARMFFDLLAIHRNAIRGVYDR